MKLIHATLRLSFLATVVLGLTACAVPTKTFEIEAIDQDDKPIKCLIVIDYKWPQEGAKDVHYTPATIEVPFKTKRVRIQVKPAQLGADGVPRKVPEETDPAQHEMGEREVEMRDPPRQLFILQRK